ncbi:MAG: GatB/YqeY domain-containing protein [Anaerolineae bacterium]|nr:GatB/YqeY domain-containing protein [Anaerolineae bacterium]
MDLKGRLQEDLKTALREKDERRKSVIRMCIAAIQLAEVQHAGPLDDAAIVGVLQKEARQRQETIDELRSVGRLEQLAEQETELAILESYLPQMLTREDITEKARAVIEQVGASGPKDLGAVMRELMTQVKGRADGQLVNQVVRELLAG